jgi:hypothetical protein
VPVSGPGQGGSDHWVGGVVSHKRASGVQQAGGVACREVFECGHCTRCGEREGKKTTGTFFLICQLSGNFCRSTDEHTWQHMCQGNIP